MAWLNAEQILRNTLYTDHTNFTDFIINMHTKWLDARALGSKINNEDFKDIIISALPESWSSATALFYDPNMTSADAIAHLQIWHTKIDSPTSAKTQWHFIYPILDRGKDLSLFAPTQTVNIVVIPLRCATS